MSAIGLLFSMASLLSKFRIDYSALKMIPDVSKPALPSTVAFFKTLITDFQQSAQGTNTDVPEEGNVTELL